MSRSLLRRLFTRCSGPRRCRPQPQRLAFGPLERRDLLATFAVDIADPGCDTPGDKLFCEIQEAVGMASSKDKIKVHAGTYQPFVVNKDKLTIREAKGHSDPIIDATGVEYGIEVNANGVMLKGLEVQNARTNGFLVSGDNNTLHGNTASDIGTFTSSDGFHVRGDNNTLTDNKAINNAGWGFFIEELLANMFDDNECERNTLGGSNLPDIC